MSKVQLTKGSNFHATSNRDVTTKKIRHLLLRSPLDRFPNNVLGEGSLNAELVVITFRLSDIRIPFVGEHSVLSHTWVYDSIYI